MCAFVCVNERVRVYVCKKERDSAEEYMCVSVVRVRERGLNAQLVSNISDEANVYNSDTVPSSEVK